MAIVVPRADITSEEVVDALRRGLPAHYDVTPGMRMIRNPFGTPSPVDSTDQILVSAGKGRVIRAQVRLERAGRRTEIHVSPGGDLGQLVMNTFGVARQVRRVLRNAHGLSSTPRQE